MWGALLAGLVILIIVVSIAPVLTTAVQTNVENVTDNISGPLKTFIQVTCEYPIEYFWKPIESLFYKSPAP
jgi:hypothetical protein